MRMGLLRCNQSMEFERTKNSNKELSEFNVLLQEELRVARDAEKNAESRRARCQAFLNQQQEVIQRLLAVKEENENLKFKLIKTEKALSMVQNNSIEEQMRKDAQIQEIQQECLKKMINLQEEANQQLEKSKSEYLVTINELRTSVSKLEEKLEEKEAVNVTLQEENQSLKELADANIETFHKKLAEQERKHQSELETWKMAEMNRSVLEQAQQQSSVTLYGTGQNYHHQFQRPHVLRPMQGYQPNITGYQKTPLVTHYKSIPPRYNTNMVHPLSSSGNHQNKPEFLSASEIFMQRNLPAGSEIEENDGSCEEKTKENNKPVETKKQKILVPNKKRKLFNSTINIL